jgi:hypothetical protein
VYLIFRVFGGGEYPVAINQLQMCGGEFPVALIKYSYVAVSFQWYFD